MTEKYSDVKVNNIMMDARPLHDELPHPVMASRRWNFERLSKPPRCRTTHPVKYYYIDFGLSLRWEGRIPGDSIMEVSGGYGGTRCVPEFQDGRKSEFCDPFAVDVFCLGNMLREYFTEVGLIPFLPLSTRII